MAEEGRRKRIVRELVSEGILQEGGEELEDERNLIAYVAFMTGWKKRKTVQGGGKEKAGKITTKPMLLEILCGKKEKKNVLDFRGFRS